MEGYSIDIQLGLIDAFFLSDAGLPYNRYEMSVCE